VRWQLSTDQVDRAVAPISVDGRLVFAGHGVFLAADPDTGRAEPIAAFSRLASFGLITTTLIEHGHRICLGVAEQGMPTELRCIEL
jgi:hypothetical protein